MPFSLSVQHDVEIIVDFGPMRQRHDDRSERRFYNRRPSNQVAGGESGVVVDGGVPKAGIQPGEPGAALTLARLRTVRAGPLAATQLWLGRGADGVDRDRNDFDAGFG